MLIIGCDYHPSMQQVACLDTEAGDYIRKRLAHRAEAEQFYRELTNEHVQVRVGMERRRQRRSTQSFARHQVPAPRNAHPRIDGDSSNPTHFAKCRLNRTEILVCGVDPRRNCERSRSTPTVSMAEHAQRVRDCVRYLVDPSGRQPVSMFLVNPQVQRINDDLVTLGTLTQSFLHLALD